MDGDSDLESEAGSANSSTTSASGQKRKRPTAVITKPLLARTKRGQGENEHRTAGWLVGRPDATTAAGAGMSCPWRGGRAGTGECGVEAAPGGPGGGGAAKRHYRYHPLVIFACLSVVFFSFLCFGSFLVFLNLFTCALASQKRKRIVCYSIASA